MTENRPSAVGSAFAARLPPANESQAFLGQRLESYTARAIGMPRWALFAEQAATYRDSVLPGSVVAIAAQGRRHWERYSGAAVKFNGMHGFRGGMPSTDLYRPFGITAVLAADAPFAALKRH